MEANRLPRPNGDRVSISGLRKPRTLAKTTEAGNIEAVAIDELKTDVYQRSIKLDKVNKFAAAYDMVAAGYILVSRRRNGDMYIIDGQHRAAAALRAGETHILAQVLDGLTLQEEAIKRLMTNDRQSETTAERFKARLVAEDPVAVGIKDVVEDHGGVISLSGMSGKTNFVALAAAEKLYLVDGDGEHLDVVLSVLGAAFGPPSSETAPAVALYSISHLLLRHPEVDRTRLAQKLGQLGMVVMAQRALAFRGIWGGSSWVNWYRAAVEAYNYQLGKGRRLDYKTPRPRMAAAPEVEDEEEDDVEADEEAEDADDNGTD